MDVLLSHGYFLAEDPGEKEIMRPYPPLGLLYISSFLKSKGFSVGVFDTTFRTKNELIAYVEKHSPKIVALYCNMMTRVHVLSLAAKLKTLGVYVIVGGPEPVNYAQEYLERNVDVVVSGEGEETMAELVPHLHKHGLNRLHEIEAIVFIDDDGKLIRNAPRPKIKNLDSLPFPDREAIEIEDYLSIWREHHGQGAVSLITARGCPFKCNWCSHSVFGHSHRRRSPKNVVEEIAFIKERYDPELLWFADDVFTIHRKWFFEYSQLLKDRGLVIPFETISREDRLDEEVITELASIQCYRLWVGAESGSQRILDLMERQTDAARVREMILRLQAHGIQAGTFVMLGYEDEEMADLDATLEHLKDALPDQLLTTVAYPIKGTAYFKKIEKRINRLHVFSESSDRDLIISERRTKKFYDYARQWMVNEVELHRIKTGRRTITKLEHAKILARSKKGRLGMLATQNDRVRI
jgi:radical SAM superfamily enzyme YgiQ (UPF0313 family)